ncbi:MAG: adenosylcobinamide-phosphate synthase CbiB [Pseudomonadota bacterium]
MSGWGLGLAVLLDLILGDPPSWPHPVRMIGWFVDKTSKMALAGLKSPFLLRLAGAVLTVATAGLTFSLAWLSLAAAGKISPSLAWAWEVMLAFTTLAAGSLFSETWRVVVALLEGDLERARALLSLVVGRETADLDRAGVLRAVIETTAENLSDGVIAPLFYLVLGGPALGLAFKAVSTMDSMIGYKNEKYLYLGWAAARTDDVLNYAPARLSAALITVSAWVLGLDPVRAFGTWMRDGGRHSSPNAGRPEAAMAGALGVQLGGPSVYHGRLVDKPTLGDPDRPISPGAALKAEMVLLTSSGLAALAALALSWAWRSI